MTSRARPCLFSGKLTALSSQDTCMLAYCAQQQMITMHLCPQFDHTSAGTYTLPPDCSALNVQAVYNTACMCCQPDLCVGMCSSLTGICLDPHLQGSIARAFVHIPRASDDAMECARPITRLHAPLHHVNLVQPCLHKKPNFPLAIT